jgi:hypothetical protein
MATAQLAQLRAGAAPTSDPLQALLARPHMSGFDPEVWHAMNERDSALVRDELMHGVASKAFVYDFSIKGTRVTGVSVIGARELASQYKGIKSRIVATVEKRGALFIFRTFTPLSIDTRVLHELADETDFYECVMEVSDIKTGNTIEVRKKETKTEAKRDGTTFERPHYDVIAESKAFRNGVLSILPQSVIAAFKERCLKAGDASQEATIDQRRAQVAAFAARQGIAVNRQALADLSFAELDGLGGAARESVESFKRSAAALGLTGNLDLATGEIPPPAAAAASPAPAPAAAPAAPASQGQRQQQRAEDWAPSPEEEAAIREREMREASGGEAEGKAPQNAPAARGRRVQTAAE